MFCVSCGKEIAEGSRFCTNCGTPIETQTQPQTVQPQILTSPPVNTYQNRGTVPIYQQINVNIPQQPAEYKTKWATVRIVIGIITVGLFSLFQLQSCVACAGESVQSIISDEEGTSGTTGYIVSYFFLIAGILSIVCRKSKGGSIAAGIVFAFCGLFLLQEDFSYFKDLAFYCFISFAFCITMIISGILQKAGTRNNA